MADSTDVGATTPTTGEQTGAAKTDAAATKTTTENLIADAKATPQEGSADNKAGEANKDEKTTEGKAAEKEGEKSEEKPVEYADFKVPEGFEVNAEKMGEFKKIAADLALPQEKAQALVDLYAQALTEADAQATKAWEQTTETWKQEIIKDPVVGGDKLDATRSTIAKALDLDNNPKLAEAFVITGAGNNPEIFRALARLSSRVVESSRHTGGNPPNTSERKAPSSVLYDAPSSNTN